MLQKDILIVSSNIAEGELLPTSNFAEGDVACELRHFTPCFSVIFEEEYEEPCTVEDSKSIRAGGLTVMMNLKCEPFSNCL